GHADLERLVVIVSAVIAAWHFSELPKRGHVGRLQGACPGCPVTGDDGGGAERRTLARRRARRQLLRRRRGRTMGRYRWSRLARWNTATPPPASNSTDSSSTSNGPSFAAGTASGFRCGRRPSLHCNAWQSM